MSAEIQTALDHDNSSKNSKKQKIELKSGNVPVTENETKQQSRNHSKDSKNLTKSMIESKKEMSAMDEPQEQQEPRRPGAMLEQVRSTVKAIRSSRRMQSPSPIPQPPFEARLDGKKNAEVSQTLAKSPFNESPAITTSYARRPQSSRKRQNEIVDDEWRAVVLDHLERHPSARLSKASKKNPKSNSKKLAEQSKSKKIKEKKIQNQTPKN
eukprot:TRINITY_DN20120_c0_g2_i1.p1 TRINITY_DN20120_c0_g2~~TRINITY_DN20120_c0_g2_i1.p1  ORF type:complete len:211 (+),score=18.05 TRINITY_DN20120_c0_g2_i1:336-968(+)